MQAYAYQRRGASGGRFLQALWISISVLLAYGSRITFESNDAAVGSEPSVVGGGSAVSPNRDNSNGFRVISIATGADHTCALMSNSGVRCWGANSTGQLGNGTTIDYSAFPTNDVLTGVQAVAAGVGHTCALMEAGDVRCWGDNSLSQLGDLTTVSQLVPPTNGVLMPSGLDGTKPLTGVRSIAAGGNQTCALTEMGDVLCWGFNVGQASPILSDAKSCYCSYRSSREPGPCFA